MTNPIPPNLLAINYFERNGIPAQVFERALLCWGCVVVDVRYSAQRRYRGVYRWSLTRPIMADVVMLICDQRDNGGAVTFHLFDPDAPYFYYHGGRQKTGVVYVPGRGVQLKHEERFYSLTDVVMAEARDRLALIEEARARE